MKMNCWEFKKCGRQAGGAHVHDLGICPASTEKKLDGFHGGKNGGRSCWVIAGTLCSGTVQGSYASKYKNCTECEFYNAVRNAEFPKFILSPVLLRQLNDPQKVAAKVPSTRPSSGIHIHLRSESSVAAE